MSNERGALAPWLARVGADQQRAELVAEDILLQCGPYESVQYRLPGKGSLVHDDEQGRNRFEATNTLFAVITDKQLFFGHDASGETTIEPIPHADITDVSVTGRFLKKALVVDVWEGGSYTFRPADKDQLTEIRAYLDEVSECWQIIEALFDDLGQTSAALRGQIESGEIKTAQETVETAEKTVERIRSQIAVGELDSVLGPRLADAERTLHQRRMRGHRRRAEILVREGKKLTGERAYTDAYHTYDRARKHLDISLGLAQRQGFDKPPTVTDLREHIDTRIANLQVLPKALGEQATERAKGTDHPDVAVEAWQEAFDHFRDALTAGWGTDFSFSGDRDALRVTVERTVANLINARLEYATECVNDGDDAVEDGAHSKAIHCYREAQHQLNEASQLSNEFRAGDSNAIHAELARVTATLSRLQAAD